MPTDCIIWIFKVFFIEFDAWVLMLFDLLNSIDLLAKTCHLVLWTLLDLSKVFLKHFNLETQFVIIFEVQKSTNAREKKNRHQIYHRYLWKSDSSSLHFRRLLFTFQTVESKSFEVDLIGCACRQSLLNIWLILSARWTAV